MMLSLADLLNQNDKTIQVQVPYDKSEYSAFGLTYRVTSADPVSLVIHHERNGKMTIDGKACMRFEIPCDRCLTPVPVEVPLEFEREIDLRKTPEQRAADLDEQPYVIGTDLDVDLLAEDELISNLPMKVLCREDCKGLCRVCGCNRNTTACSCDDHSSEDLRMSVIREIFEKSKEV